MKNSYTYFTLLLFFRFQNTKIITKTINPTPTYGNHFKIISPVSGNITLSPFLFYIISAKHSYVFSTTTRTLKFFCFSKWLFWQLPTITIYIVHRISFVPPFNWNLPMIIFFSQFAFLHSFLNFIKKWEIMLANQTPEVLTDCCAFWCWT